jgi:hypothetical protein
MKNRTITFTTFTHRSIFLFILALSCTTISAQEETRVFEEWAKQKGEQNMVHHSRTVTDQDKNVYVIGSTINTNLDYDIMVVKYDRKGNELWEDIISGSASGDDHGLDLILDEQGRLIITGTVLNTNSIYDLILRKYNQMGDILWTQYYNGTNNLIDGGTSLCLGANSEIFVGGGTFDANSLSDFLIMKYDSNGVQQWVNTYDFIGLHEVVTKITYRGGRLLVTGASEAASGKWEMSTLSVNEANGSIWSTYRTGGSSEDIDRVTDIIIDDNDFVYVVGAVKNIGTGYDMKLVKLDENLNLIWSEEIDGGYGLEDQANAVQVDANSNVYVTGFITTSQQGKDYYTCKYNVSGVQQWNTIFDGEDEQNDKAIDLVLDEQGNIYVTGTSYHITNEDFYTIKYDNNGVIKWETAFNSIANKNDRAIDIAMDDDGDLLVVGQVQHFDEISYSKILAERCHHAT